MHTRQSILAAIAEFCEPRKLVPTPGTVFRHNDFDSLDLVELNMFLEKRYGISIDRGTTYGWTTVDSVIDTVIAALPYAEVSESTVDLDEDHPLWCVNLQIKELLGGNGVSEDLASITSFLHDTGLPKGTVTRMVKALMSGELKTRVGDSPNLDSSIRDILTEFHAATANFPQWPTDPLHALAVVQEEVGEVQKEVLQLTYEPHKSSVEKVRKEAIQMAAMSLRFLLSLDVYKYAPSEQHEQQQ